MADVTAHRAAILHCLRDPSGDKDPVAAGSVEYFEDGLLVVADGLVEAVGPADELLARLPSTVPVTDHGDKLIIPGLIDCHVHYPQIDIIGSYGERLLDWLERYAYPAERAFADPAHAQEVAEFFVQELLRNGTTTACVFATVHPHSVDAIFEAAAKAGMRLIAGKVMMDRNCPADLRDTPATSYEQSRALIEKWHGRDRLLYAVTPRFAITSSEAQLREAGRLLQEFPDVYLHTHLAENEEEVKRVAELFPWSRSYLHVYEHFGLVRERSVFAHCIHMEDEDRRLMARKGAAMAFCPSSNLFLGSGLFDLAASRRYGVHVGVGTDVGGGTSLSLLRTLGDGYKALKLREQPLSPFAAFYLVTQGAALALHLHDRIGNFEKGKEADFNVLDPFTTTLASRRWRTTPELANRLFLQLMLGDERAVSSAWVSGRACGPHGSTARTRASARRR
ncbi:MAG TPA: guanine deaminase [Woeseiaceae bacterium]|nr:guanine deaminase [Woeseiaceae bacterium]